MATLNLPHTVLVRRDGSLLIAEPIGHRVRKINAAGIITTFVGNGISGFTSSAVAATAANLYGPSGLAEDALGNVYIGSIGAIQKVSPSGALSTVAGDGTRFNNGDGFAASLATVNWPISMAFDASGNLFFLILMRMSSVKLMVPPVSSAMLRVWLIHLEIVLPVRLPLHQT